MNSDPHRNQHGSSWWAKAIVYTAAATAAAAAAGWGLGLVGSQVPFRARLAAAALLALTAVVVGVLDLARIGVSVVQCDRETAQAWLTAGPLRWAARNGAALGVGVTSRIGFWLWYAIPASALLLGDPLHGALLYGVYGFVRAAAVWPMLLGWLNRVDGGDPSTWLVFQHDRARRWTALYQIALGAAVSVLVGL